MGRGDPLSAGADARSLLRHRLGEGRTEARAVEGDAPLGRFAEVAPEGESVRDLDYGGRPDASTLSEERGAISADDLDPWIRIMFWPHCSGSGGPTGGLDR
ncbi:hypothetical protein GCM10010195_19880 [Kitasatospora griseola]|nr:hypothetical protein GCM10010195_19880 [Kitasatospora griseola]